MTRCWGSRSSSSTSTLVSAAAWSPGISGIVARVPTLIPGKHPAAAIVEAHRDRLRRDKPANAHNQFGTARPVALKVHGDQPVDHLSLARQDFRHVGGNVTRYRAEAVGMAGEIGDLGAPDLVLAGQAVRVGAGATDQLAFDH